MSGVPWDRLDIPDELRPELDPGAPREVRRRAVDRAYDRPEVQLAALYVLATGDDAEIREAATARMRALPNLRDALHHRTHGKIVEWVATHRIEPQLDEQIAFLRNANERTLALVARRADARLAEAIADDHERLMLTPAVIVDLFENPATPDAAIERARAFLRMEHCLPPLPESRGAAPPPSASLPAAPIAHFDVEAEIEAALRGDASPHLGARAKLEMFDVDRMGGKLLGFDFDFKADDEFSMDMLEDRQGTAPDEERGKLEKVIAAMSPGKKIKLAYLGNKEVRNILIRDRSKQVACAVVKSGRLTDAEVLAHAGNRNLGNEVLREIATNKEWIRKYPVKLALVNNPRVPVSITMSFVSILQKKDLDALARNRNVASVLTTAALKLSKAKGAG